MLDFEHKKSALASREKFLGRVLRYCIYSFSILGISLGMGVLGYHYIAGLPWIDALVNASMILTGMGPVDRILSTAGKFFASFYALYSGVAFLSTVAVLFAPLVHRFLHAMHVGDNGD